MSITMMRNDTNRSRKKDPLEDIRSFEVWAWAGGAAVTANLVVLTVFAGRPQLRRKYTMQIALAVGDLINGISFLYGSLDRIRTIHDGSYYTKHTAWRCCQKPWVSLATLGSHIPTFVTLMMACEKFVAVFKPVYYKNVHFRDRIKIIIFAYSVCFSLLLTQHLGAYFDTANAEVKSKGLCYTHHASTSWFSLINYITVVFGNLIAFVLTCAAYIKARKVSKAATANQNSDAKSESQNINALLLVSFFSVVLIVYPNGVLLLKNTGVRALKDASKMMTQAIGMGTRSTVTLFPLNSVVNVFIYFAFFKQFREQAIKIATCGKFRALGTNAVSTFPATRSRFGAGIQTLSPAISIRQPAAHQTHPQNITTF